MKQIAIAIFLLATIVSVITTVFAYNQVSLEKERLSSDLQYRSTLLAETLRATIEPQFRSENPTVQNAVTRLSSRERLSGIWVFDSKGSVIASVSALNRQYPTAPPIADTAMDADLASSVFERIAEKNMHVLAVPVHLDNRVVGAIMVMQNAEYIDARLEEIWKSNLVRLTTQILALAIAMLLILRWILYEPVRALADTLRLIRTGKSDSDRIPESGSVFLKPLFGEIAKMKKSLLEARRSAMEEARLGLEKHDSPWTGERLREFIKDVLKDRKIVIVSNREPYVHTHKGKDIVYHVPASGMVTALEPIMQACGDTWIAQGSGDADRVTVDEHDRIRVPPSEPSYTLKRVWVSDEDNKSYYNGFCNEGLWALCHQAHTRPTFRREDWTAYKKVNGMFAQSVLSEIKGTSKPVVFVQDFHFALLPRMIKQARPDAMIGLFWHIPWVSAEAFSICPWKKDVLRGMLGADLVGFHTQLHCNNFIESVGRELEALINYEQFTVTHEDHLSFIKPFPISIAFTDGGQQADSGTRGDVLKKSLGISTKFLGIGVDRMDYTKGILERLKAVEIFLGRYPSYKEKFTFLQIAAPSRGAVPKYREFSMQVNEETKRINALYETKSWKPIVLVEQLYSHIDLLALYRKANFCLVTSLHDGMNLVSKEYIAARDDHKGVLILSQFTGAVRELKHALIVNPYDGEETSEAMHTALTMPESEQMKRMKKMRNLIRGSNVYRWSAEFLKTMVNLE